MLQEGKKVLKAQGLDSTLLKKRTKKQEELKTEKIHKKFKGKKNKDRGSKFEVSLNERDLSSQKSALLSGKKFQARRLD